MKSRPVLWAGGAALTAIVVAVCTSWPAPSAEKGGGMAPVAVSPMALPVVQRDTPSTQPAQVAVVARQQVASKSAEMKRLGDTGNPVDAYRAYRLAADCVQTRLWQTQVQQQSNSTEPLLRAHLAKHPKVEQVCGDLSPGQIASRSQYLRTAALAGVHGAFQALMMYEGPQGMLATYADDAEWKALERDALQASLRTADPAALLGRSDFLLNCENQYDKDCKPDIEQVLKYWVAARDARALARGEPLPAANDPVTARYSKLLPSEVAERAIAQGRQLVATAARPQ